MPSSPPYSHVSSPAGLTSPGSAASTNDQPKFRCTICRKGFPKSDPWKKHEKEQHFFTYICKPEGLANAQGDCSICSSAGCHPLIEINPHGMGRCAQRDIQFKRRADMVQHLKERHKITLGKETIEQVANGFLFPKHGAWSCGFCGQCFCDFRDRLRHIQGHYEAGLSFEDWSCIRVMQGLVLQPALEEAVRIVLGPQGKDVILACAWDNASVSRLQPRLERGTFNIPDAITLVEEACDASK